VIDDGRARGGVVNKRKERKERKERKDRNK